MLPVPVSFISDSYVTENDFRAPTNARKREKQPTMILFSDVFFSHQKIGRSLCGADLTYVPMVVCQTASLFLFCLIYHCNLTHIYMNHSTKIIA